MNLTIRPELPQDYRQTENMTREAFWDVYKPGCDEHYLLHIMRNTDAFVNELNFVAYDGSIIMGNIVYMRMYVMDLQANRHEVLGLGPVAVLPLYQKQGIGSRLIRHTIDKARELGYKGIFLYGSPLYYPKFGFVNAVKFDIQTADGENPDYFMGLELYPNSLKGISGRYIENPVFQADHLKVDIFDQQFPPKEKHVTDTQLNL